MMYFIMGVLLYCAYKMVSCIYTVNPDECAVITSFGRAQRADNLEPAMGEDGRYEYPRVIVKRAGVYVKMPWQKAHKISTATESVDLCWDPTKSQRTIEAVTKDNLTTGVNGQIRYRVSPANAYAFLFGVDSPLEHVMGFFISVMRERIANFIDPKGGSLVGSEEQSSADDKDSFEGVSINDLRKNLPLLNQYMEEQCRRTSSRYGIELDAALITEIDPPSEVDHALSAINSTRNQVAADLSTARADSEQQITMSKRAVEIARNNAESEVAPLRELADTLAQIKENGGQEALGAYIRNLRVPLLKQTRRIFHTTK